MLPVSLAAAVMATWQECNIGRGNSAVAAVVAAAAERRWQRGGGQLGGRGSSLAEVQLTRQRQRIGKRGGSVAAAWRQRGGSAAAAWQWQRQCNLGSSSIGLVEAAAAVAAWRAVQRQQGRGGMC
jgi:hypothetical protein